MIYLHFRGVSSAQSKSLGPAAAFRVAGNFVREEPGNVLRAVYRNHSWQVQDDHFPRYDCEQRSMVHFEDLLGGRSEQFGPFAHIMVADGTMYADDRLFAKFVEESQLWHCFETENYWAAMVLQPA